jgi:copper chaperone CopZ
VEGVQEFKVEIPPKDQAFIIYDPLRTSEDALTNAIIDAGYDVKEVVKLD